MEIRLTRVNWFKVIIHYIMCIQFYHMTWRWEKQAECAIVRVSQCVRCWSVKHLLRMLCVLSAKRWHPWQMFKIYSEKSFQQRIDSIQNEHITIFNDDLYGWGEVNAYLPETGAERPDIFGIALPHNQLHTNQHNHVYKFPVYQFEVHRLHWQNHVFDNGMHHVVCHVSILNSSYFPSSFNVAIKIYICKTSNRVSEK